jgi:biopolymer transport protein ExbD
MAMTVHDNDDDLTEAHEINVTPFIDVILVLLIIFMVAAPLATVDVKVDLPPASAAAQARPDKPVFLTLRSDLSLLIGETPVPRDQLTVALDAASGGDREQRVFVRTDRAVSYGDMMEALNALGDAGYLKIALVGLERAATP